MIRSAGPRLARLIVTHPRSALLLCIALIAGMGYGLFTHPISVNTNTREFLVETDPARQGYQRFQERFAENGYFVVAITPSGGNSVFNRETFEVVEQLTSYIEDQTLVLRVRSLTNYQRLGLDDHGETLRIRDVWPLQAPLDNFDALEEALSDDALVVGSIMSRDKGSALLGVRLSDGSSEQYAALVESVESYLLTMNKRGHAITMSGQFAMQTWMMRAANSDLALMLPIIALVCALLLWMFMRRMVVVWTAIAGTCAASACTFGLLAYAEQDLNVVTIILPVLLCPLGVADTIHICSAFFRNYRGDNGGNGTHASEVALRAMALPCTLTSFTTAMGFLVLTLSDVQPLRELGVEAAIGVTMLLFFDLVGLPAILAMYRGADAPETRAPSAWANRFALWGPGATRRWRWPIVGGLTVLAAVCLASLDGLVATTNTKEFFRPGSYARDNVETTDAIAGGSYSIEMTFDSGQIDGIEDPEFLRRIHDLQQWVNEEELGARAISLVDYLKTINERFELVADPASPAGQPDYHYLPPHRDMLAQMILLYENLGPRDAVNQMVDESRRYYRLSVRLPSEGRLDMQERVAAIQSHVAAAHPELEVEYSGAAVLFLALDDHVLGTLPTSFLLSLLVVAACLLLTLRSWTLWLLSLLPNVLPIFVVGGVMVYLDIPVDMATALVGAVTLGLVVDDTIHFFVRAREELDTGVGLAEALAATYRKAGNAILVTSVVLVCGFGVQVFSEFVPNSRMGILASCIIALACLTDLIVVPAIMWLVFPSQGRGRPITTALSAPESEVGGLVVADAPELPGTRTAPSA